jgi:hypothetical protein
MEQQGRGMPVNASPDPQPSKSRASIRMDARLDAVTRAKVDDLATHFRKPRATVLCYIMHWGLSHAETETRDSVESEGPVCHLYLFVDTALHERVEEAASAAGVKSAPWLRSVVRQISMTDFPASWEEERSEERSHDSRIYDTRFMLRLDETAQTKLQQLITQFGTSKADIIRRLIMQATPENFPASWHMNTGARRIRQTPRDAMGRDREPKR